MTGAARVDVWQDDGGRWRWRHRDADGGDVLRNESRPTWDQAVHTAGVAYPGVPMEVRTPAEPPERGRAGLAAALRKVVWFLLAVVAAITIGIGLLVRRIARLLGR